MKLTTEKEGRRNNSTDKKLAVQCLNEAMCFLSSSVLADRFELRNRDFFSLQNVMVHLKRQYIS
jgi:hypothetical protein